MVDNKQRTIFIIIFIIVAILFIWWLYTIFYRPKTVSCGNDFKEMYENFESYNTSLWLSNSYSRLNDALGDNVYHYVILDSAGRVIYDNKCRRNSKKWTNNNGDDNNGKNKYKISKLINTFEVTGAVANGSLGVIRYGIRNLAIRVNDCNIYRVVHISSPNITI